MVKSLVTCGLLLTVLCACECLAGELTFELPDKEEQCFHELIEKDVGSVLEFQVIYGGNNDVDVELTGPNRESLYSEQKAQHGSFTWTASVTGEYKFCFSNKFSTITHKIIYMDFESGDEEDSLRMGGEVDKQRQMTQLETSIFKNYENMNSISEYQKHHLLRESQGRSFAEDLNERVQFWSIGQTVIILLVGVGQILVLRSFFSDQNRSNKRYGQHKTAVGT